MGCHRHGWHEPFSGGGRPLEATTVVRQHVSIMRTWTISPYALVEERRDEARGHNITVYGGRDSKVRGHGWPLFIVRAEGPITLRLRTACDSDR